MGASIIINSSAVASDASSKASTTHSGNLLPLLEEIRGLAAAESAEDPAAHSRLLSKIHALNLAVETPLETILKIGYQPWQIVAIRVALDLNVFVFLAEQEPKPISVEELASNAGADVILLGMSSCNRSLQLLTVDTTLISMLLARIMRVIMALGLCSEVGSGRYAANSKTAIMTTPLGSAGFRFWTDMSMPTAAKLPDSLRGNSYSNPRDNKTTAFAQAFGAEFWTWLKQNPEHAKEFNGFMASRRQGRPGWFDIYPVEQELSMTVEDGAVVLVDVGGNQGHDLVNLKKKYPNLRGNFILQDLPEVVAKATFNDEDITAMGYNFFEPQPVKRTHAHFSYCFLI